MIEPLRIALALLFSCGVVVVADEIPDGKTRTNSLDMKLVRIEPGTFSMGSTAGEFDEQPVHRVTISQPFEIGATEVTNAEYEKFAPGHERLRGKRGFSTADDEAVVFVSWHEAVAFCRWLSEKEGLPYRLPTEAEWEYACRAGTTTAYHTGETLPTAFHKNQRRVRRDITPVELRVGQAPANAWGLLDMHGNVEEWCHDGYGPYALGPQTDPVGRAGADFRVTRGGSHSTLLPFLRSANRLGTLPEDKHWLIGFRVVVGAMPRTKPLPPVEPPLWARNVAQEPYDWSDGPDATKPYFKSPRKFVKIPAGSTGQMFSQHNHQPAITACPNGDLLAIWYSTISEPGRELVVVASRLRRGNDQWDPASPFWDAPDRNDHGNALLWDGERTIYHFNGLSTDAGWAKLSLIVRTSTDSGATWSKARIVDDRHDLHNQVIEGALRTREGYIIVPCDAVPQGQGGTAIHVSRDGGQTFVDPAAGKPAPKFDDGASGAWIAGIHGGVTQLADGRLLALGRGDSIRGRMPRSISADMGGSWSYSASEFPPIGGGQRLVLERLREGPLFLASFAERLTLTDAAGKSREGSGLYAAVSFDEGRSWPVRRLITDDGLGRPVETTDGRAFTMSATSAEPRGYLSCTQAPDGVIHLISSRQHYAFNLSWLKAPAPAVPLNP